MVRKSVNSSPSSIARSAHRLRRSLRQNWSLYILLAIPIVYALVFEYYPMYGAQIAFRNFNVVKGIRGSDWVGLKHFRAFFHNKTIAWRLIRNTLSISLTSLATYPIPILLALLIHYMPSKRFGKTAQMLTYMPHFISTVVLCGMIMQFFATRDGLINGLIGLLGIPPQDFLGSKSAFVPIYVGTGVWQEMGYNSIIFISALAGVDMELHEAAKIDGATLRQRMWHVDLPGIASVIITMFILRCGKVLSVGYQKVYLLQNTLNISVSEVISTYVYKQGIQAAIPQYSYATAIGLLTSVINFSLLMIVNKISRKVAETSLW